MVTGHLQDVPYVEIIHINISLLGAKWCCLYGALTLETS
jgi:hypothetical protein